MGLQSIGQNGASEFFETLIQQTAYSEAQQQINGFTKDVESPILQDAIQSSMTVLSSGLIFMLMRKQEDFIENVFATSKTLILTLVGSQYAQKVGGKLKGLVGVKLSKFMNFFKSSFSDRVALAQVVATQANTHFSAESTSQNSQNNISNTMAIKEHLVNKETLNYQVGNSMASRYNETLIFKLFTKSFTENDKTVIKKILGRDTASELNIDDMNQVADFMFVTDNDGNVTGLTEQLFSLLNGLGYMHT